jgi:hypothetical protein
MFQEGTDGQAGRKRKKTHAKRDSILENLTQQLPLSVLRVLVAVSVLRAGVPQQQIPADAETSVSNGVEMIAMYAHHSLPGGTICKNWRDVIFTELDRVNISKWTFYPPKPPTLFSLQPILLMTPLNAALSTYVKPQGSAAVFVENRQHLILEFLIIIYRLAFNLCVGIVAINLEDAATLRRWTQAGELCTALFGVSLDVDVVRLSLLCLFARSSLQIVRQTCSSLLSLLAVQRERIPRETTGG